MAKIPDQYGSDRPKSAIGDNPKPDAQTVEDFHTNADTDTRPEAAHHSLGPSPSQAAPGDHLHDGGTSQLLLTGVTLSGSRGGNVAMVSIISALVRLGAIDSTTA